jgi:Flp pilus assembly protein TadG
VERDALTCEPSGVSAKDGGAGGLPCRRRLPGRLLVGRGVRGTPRSRLGLATIELALVLPILLLLVLGTIEYGWMFVRVHQLSAAAHAGARAGALNGGTVSDARSAIAARLEPNGFGNNYELAFTPGDPGTLGRGEAFTVTVTVKYARVGALGITLIPTPDTLTARATIAREGP